ACSGGRHRSSRRVGAFAFRDAHLFHRRAGARARLRSRRRLRSKGARGDRVRRARDAPDTAARAAIGDRRPHRERTRDVPDRRVDPRARRRYRNSERFGTDHRRGAFEISMARLFGTDGVRGVANMDLTPELALALGRAAGCVLGGMGHGVIVGRDTRRSGRMLESALAAGLCSVGMEVWLAGVIPTPGLAYLARIEDVVAGAVISASHNPAPDNGIKFFDHGGLKLPDATEDRIEAG